MEVRQCPLGSGARGGGPAVPTGIWTARRRRRGEEAEEAEVEAEEAEAEEEGGEQL